MPVFIVDKPLGLTSHDVVAKTRKLLKTKRVGHAGTLDPLATGVLVILTEDATKLSPYLTASDKHYLAWVSFGASTPTLDAEGPVEEMRDASGVTLEQIQAASQPFLELTEQLPPLYSAVKKGGVKGYEAARKGETIELTPRAAGYSRIDLLGFAATRDELPTTFSLSPDGSWQPNERGVTITLPQTLGDFPTALFFVSVQAGTYLRSFARDIGEALGTGAHLSGLVRMRAGRSGLEGAISLESLPEAAGVSNAEALPYPLITLNDADVKRVQQGKGLEMDISERVGLVDMGGNLVAIAEPQEGRLKVLRVWQD